MGQDIFGADKKNAGGAPAGGAAAGGGAGAGGGGPKVPTAGGIAGTYDPNYQVGEL